MRWWQASAASLTIGCAVVACGAEPSAGTDGDPVVSVPTNSYRDGMMWPAAALDGRLSVSSASGTQCLVLTLDAGHSYSVTWPKGFGARFGRPAELVNAEGEVIAREGDHLQVGGGFTGRAPDGPCAAPTGEEAFSVGPISVVAPGG